MDDTQLEQPDQAQIHAKRLETEIASLRAISQAPAQSDFKGFWTHSKLIIELFKTLRPLKSEDRQRLWDNYRSLCDEMHKKQTLQRDALKTGSKALRAEIESAIAGARELLAEDSPEALTKARDLLRTSLQSMKGEPRKPASETTGFEPAGEATAMAQTDTLERSEPVHEAQAEQATAMPVDTTEPPEPSLPEPELAPATAPTAEARPRLLKDDREECWRQWQEVRTAVQERLDALLASASMTATELVTRAQTENPPVVLKSVRDLQQQVVRLGLPRESREQIRSTLNEAWNVAIGRLQHMREERKAKHQEWRTRMEENLQRWHSQVERREQSIAHLQAQVEKLQDMLLNARTDEHRDRVRTWMNEATEKLQKNEAAALEIREKITAVEGKLRK